MLFRSVTRTPGADACENDIVSGSPTPQPPAPAPAVRLDVWLDVACLFKTRSEAQKACSGGKVDVNGVAAKPHRLLRVGDAIEISRPFGRKQQLIVTALADRHIAKAEAREESVEELVMAAGMLAGQRIGGPAPDPVLALTYAAARTRRIKLGSSVSVLPGRPPAVVATYTALRPLTKRPFGYQVSPLTRGGTRACVERDAGARCAASASSSRSSWRRRTPDPSRRRSCAWGSSRTPSPVRRCVSPHR